LKDSRRKILRVFVGIAIVCPLTICGVGFGLFRKWFAGPAEDLPRQIAAAKKEGIPIEADDLRPKSAISPDQNAAKIYRSFFVSTDRAFKDPELVKAYNELVKGTATPDQIQIISKALERCREPLAEIAAASKRPVCDFGYRYEDGPNMRLPEMAQAKQAVKLLVTQARLLGSNGRVREGYEAVAAADRVGRHVGQTPNLIAALVEISIDRIVAKEFASLLQQSGNDAGLLTLAQRTLDGFGPPADLRHALSGEVVFARLVIRSIRTLGDFKALSGAGSDQPAQWNAGEGPTIPPTILKGVEAKVIERWRGIFKGLPKDAFDWEGFYNDLARADTEIANDHSITSEMSSITFPVLAPVALALGSQIADRRLSATSIKLLQIRRSTGHLPAALPTFGQISIDPFDGKPLRYRLNGTGFTLYSIGGDREDNGGVLPKGNQKGDLVRSFH
jgi:hypothetical protein